MPAPVPTDKLGEFGQAIRETREKLGLSQDRLAELLGVGQSYVSAIERGAADIRVSMVSRFAEVLGLDFPDLLAKLARDQDNPDLQPTEKLTA